MSITMQSIFRFMLWIGAVILVIYGAEVYYQITPFQLICVVFMVFVLIGLEFIGSSLYDIYESRFTDGYDEPEESLHPASSQPPVSKAEVPDTPTPPVKVETPHVPHKKDIPGFYWNPKTKSYDAIMKRPPEEG